MQRWKIIVKSQSRDQTVSVSVEALSGVFLEQEMFFLFFFFERTMTEVLLHDNVVQRCMK